MEKTLYILMIAAIIVFAVCMLLILFVSKNRKILSLINKMTEAESVIKENLKNKLELNIRAINIIERELKIESKMFGEVKKIKADKINDILFDNILSDATKEINEFKEDYKELSKTKSFDGIIKDIYDIDIYLTGARRFFNKNATTYNNLIKVFPNNIIAKLKRYNIKNFYSESLDYDDIKMDLDI